MRVQLLLRSGEQYGTHTVEGRLLTRHFTNEAMFRYSSTKWLFDRVSDLITVCGFGSVDPTSAKNYEKQIAGVQKYALDFIDPFRHFAEDAKRQQRKDDERRGKLLDEIASKGTKGYGSLAAIKESLGMLKKTIQESAG